MIRFFYKLFLFSTLVTAIILLMCIVYVYQVRNFYKPKIEINSVFLGDSHFQNGINDELIMNSKNYATSAEALIYSRIKLNYLLSKNHSIDNVFLSVGSHTFSNSVDTSWICSEDNFLAKTSSFYPLYRMKDVYELTEFSGHYSFILLLHKILWQNIYSIERQILVGKLPFIGGYTPNNQKLSIDQNETINDSTIFPFRVSKIQQKEFLKIKNKCKEANVNLILINTPVYRTSKENDCFGDSELCELISDLTIWDYSDLFDKPHYFADRNHLNPYGAEILSKLVNDSLNIGFKTQIN